MIANLVTKSVLNALEIDCMFKARHIFYLGPARLQKSRFLKFSISNCVMAVSGADDRVRFRTAAAKFASGY